MKLTGGNLFPPWPRPKPRPDQKQLDRIEKMLAEINKRDMGLLAAINNPAWLTPAPSPALAAAVFYPPVVDVGGEVYRRIAAVQASVDQLKGVVMSAYDDAKAALDTLVGLATQAQTTLDSLATQLDALAASGGATTEQLEALAAEATGASGPLSDAIARDTRPVPPPP